MKFWYSKNEESVAGIINYVIGVLAFLTIILPLMLLYRLITKKEYDRSPTKASEHKSSVQRTQI